MSTMWHSERIIKDVEEQKQRLIHRKPGIAKTNAKSRGHGFKPLNKYFIGCAAHHIDHELVIYIPETLHKKYPAHRQDNPKSMIEINKEAIKYLELNGGIKQLKIKKVLISFTAEEHKKIKLIKDYYNLTWHELIIKCTDELAEKIDDPFVKELIE